jgi:predicted ATPase
MIQSIHIQNFKSVYDLSLDLGTFNVLIGENGCGKSNILEAIAFGAAAYAYKLDYEYFGSRGIRITNPEFMYSAFEKKDNNHIKIKIEIENQKYNKEIRYDIDRMKWIDDIEENENKLYLSKILLGDFEQKRYDDKFIKLVITRPFSNFINYSPEQTSLRKFEDSNQIRPLGIKGEGLFQYLKELIMSDKPEYHEMLSEIKENLYLLDWYDDFELPKHLMSNEFSLKIKDKYLDRELQFFDQKSTNEGFLFLLFYTTLFVSKITPSFFAIDNIDTSFNPKLCKHLVKNLVELAKKHQKQVIVTTHNPAILDGLNLQDDTQRLFVVRRNEDGHTKATRIEYKEERKMKLSELWTNGFIGGLPDNF